MFNLKGQSKKHLKPAPSTTFGDSWDYDHDLSTTGADDSHNNDTLSSNPSFDLSTTSSTNSKLTRVSVTGVIFMIEPIVFDKLKRLPWEWSTSDECLLLQTSPDLVEILLNYVIFDSFPIALDKTDIEELEPMTMVLGLSKLEAHLRMLNKYGHWGSKRRSRQASTSGADNTFRGWSQATQSAHSNKGAKASGAGNNRHWETARKYFANKTKHRKLDDQAMLDAEYLS